MPQRDLGAAKSAFQEGDVESSMKAHDSGHTHSEKHSTQGDLIKSIVFGGLDGIVTTFAVIAAAVGSTFKYEVLLCVACANLVGDAFSMGLGDYISSRAETEAVRKKQKNVLEQCEVRPQPFKEELFNIFCTKGFSAGESEKIIACLSTNAKSLADVFLLETEGFSVDDDGGSPVKDGIVTFISFMFFGGIPVIAFLFTNDFKDTSSANANFFVSCGLTALALFTLGSVKNKILLANWWKGGLSMLINGSITTALAYGVGYALEKVPKFL
eukprot:gb/GECH01012181.1/.p1 GENE.gb/GECH01012181.1/~~gb/GECH01012181.1/.p1  ORF type:complete len:270 (+),score=54.54 gb/GECH01012181.1/:1-810(+)